MTVRIGVNGHDPVLYFLSTLGILERRLAAIGEDVQWVSYSPGPRAPWLLGDTLDIVGCGQTPIIRAHAEGVDAAYLASSPNRPCQGALLVRKEGSVHSPKDLRGARVAFPSAAWAALLVIGTLDIAGLTLHDIVPMESDFSEDLNLLLSGEIDAAPVLGPRLVEAEETGKVRHLLPTDDVVCNRHLFTTQRRFIDERPEILVEVFAAMELANLWVTSDFTRAAEQRAAESRYDADHWGGNADSWEKILRRMPWHTASIDSAFIDEQQRYANLLKHADEIDRAANERSHFVPELAWLVREGVRRAHVEFANNNEIVPASLL
ncbi:Putative aliphatic sulfonates-binding protein [Corynebacterium provencense]|uniref:Aliphatic sulfonates-binding protein n=1 Tax=Corynebacterium provencense TaxID=1737425 RepID=A0A2Z3YMB2_9CORY|nr:ABC transporter substrate-binding protein [Corynebacterium provencense]AWT24958.1 Putative aliphatic sulfonates-binding protein [Corynebacterium provencense]